MRRAVIGAGAGPVGTASRRDGRRRIRAIGLSALELLAIGVAAAAGLAIRQRRAFAFAPTADATAARLVAGASGRVGEPVVALIGDSWVSRNKLDAPLTRSLSELGLSRVRVESFGQPGAQSRRILQNLFAVDGDEFSSAAVLRDASVRHCIVIAGVNDTAGYVGADFYAHHMIEIARTLIDHGVRPLIVEVPEYGIEHVRRSTASTVKVALFRRLFDRGEVDVVPSYRAELERRLVESGLRDRVTLIDFDEITTDYDADVSLYRDPSHLNEDGQKRFADLLARTVLDELSRGVGEEPPTLRADGDAPEPTRDRDEAPAPQRVAAR